MSRAVVYCHAIRLAHDVETLLHERARLVSRIQAIDAELSEAFHVLACDQPIAVPPLDGPLSSLSEEIARRSNRPHPPLPRIAMARARKPIPRGESVDADVIAAICQGYRTQTEIVRAVSWSQAAVSAALKRLVTEGRLFQRVAAHEGVA